MTKYGKHPWPTDGVTKKQLDRDVDRLERLYQRMKELWREVGTEITTIKSRIKDLEDSVGTLDEFMNDNS